ncbi:MAG: valine--tRNA ligase [Deltaproteobacteria bacterium]|nr:MAG: valine--tRNA ligase [Deltaproteobacteria bacterium]
MSKIEGTYSPQEFEEKWYDEWTQKGYFHADPHSDKPPFSIVIPPPNVTGILHMGHALNNTLQDVMTRYKRMDGYEALWMPGTDHAGIATQNVVERKLAAEGLTREDLGRDNFIERVWEWRKEYGGTIIRQLKKLGASCDWDRERFTMDEGLSRAVREVFCTLYEEGLIYKGSYIINWCPRCHTALADDEVEHKDSKGNLWHLRYPLEDGSGYIDVATTRPETMLGDTAVAVHPEDERYKDLIGKNLILPVMNRRIPIIADAFVDPTFGSGAVKVTPAHDPNDFEMGLRHSLPTIRVIGENGQMTEEAGKYAGLDRYEARKALVADLEEAGTLIKIDDHDHAVGGCYRCQTVIEPLISEQWFVKVKPLAAKAVEAVEQGDTKIVPDHWKKTYYHWMENIRDWCISRQIWWGHRIPAFTCDACGEMSVSREDIDTCPKCGASGLRQEDDVLDTWFSSALWPFSTMGWPEETAEVSKFYPTSLLVTGFDILFFWVARMMMMGLWFRKEVPFKDVYLHALLRDEQGRKMSKSLGNSLDPLELIEEFGADVMRFTLVAFAAQGRDIRLSKPRFEGYLRFANKIWNAARFAFMNLEDFDEAAPEIPLAERSSADRWIIGRLSEAAKGVREALDDYRFNDAAGQIYKFLWHEFCDWYVEMSKRPLYGDDPKAKLAAQQTIITVFDATMRLLHPFMPFLSEELWQKLPFPAYMGPREESLVIAVFPKAEEIPTDKGAVERVDMVKEVVSAVRNVRGEMRLPPSKKLTAIIQCSDKERSLLLDERDFMMALALAESVEFIAPGEPKPKQAAAAVAGGLEIFVPLAGLVDLEEEERRLNKEIDKLAADLSKVEGKLGNPNFVDRAPAEVVEKERERAAELNEAIDKLKAGLARIKGE